MPESHLLYSIRFSDLAPASITARELIQVLSAFNSMSAKASRTYFGSDTPTSVRITHVQPGSIDIQGFVEVAATLQSTLPALPSLALGVKDIPELIKQWLDILKFLKGSPPQKIQNVKNGNAVQIENISGENNLTFGQLQKRREINEKILANIVRARQP